MELIIIIFTMYQKTTKKMKKLIVPITVLMAIGCQKELQTSKLSAEKQENSYTNYNDSVIFSQNIYPHRYFMDDSDRCLIADSFYVNFDSCMMISAVLTVTGGTVSRVKLVIDNQHIDSLIECNQFNEFAFVKGYWITKGWHYLKFKGSADCGTGTKLTCSLPLWSIVFGDMHGMNEGLDEWAQVYGLPLSKIREVSN